MAVTIASQSVKMTADADADPRALNIFQIIFDGSGLTAGQRIAVQSTDGSEIYAHTIRAANDGDEANYADNYWSKGVTVSASGVTGTWTITIVTG